MTTMNLPRIDDSPGCILRAGDFVFPLASTDVVGHVDGTGVVWTVRQTFVNPLSDPAEAVYTFPLPHDGAVKAMTMTIGERTVVAVIKERGEAVVEYNEAIAQGHTAGLVTQERAEIFTTVVGNIHPGESVSVTITIHGVVAVDEDVATLRFPTMIKERYSRGDLPDSGRLDPPTVPVPVRVESSVTVEFTEAVPGLVCETFPGAVVAGRTVTISDDSALRADVVLRWDVPRTFAAARWVADGGSDTGTLEVTVRTEAPASAARSRYAVSILLDRSGSMEGHYMEWARRITEAVIASLGDDDLIHVLSFDTQMEPFDATAHGFVAATRSVRTSLLRELATVGARGGTDLDIAIAASGAALATLDDAENDEPGRERVVVLLTDGAVGDEASAMNYRRSHLAGARVISVAIGENANGFLQALSANGACVFLEAGHQVAEVAAKVAARIATPAHRNARLVLSGRDGAMADQAPSLAPDIYPGLVVTLWGRMARPVDGATVDVTCDDGVVATVPVAISHDASVTTRWAGALIKALDADVMAEDDAERAKAIETRIVELSVKHSVLSKYTAWLAVDRTRTTDTVIARTIVQPRFDGAMNTVLFCMPAPSSSMPDSASYFSDVLSDPFADDFSRLIDDTDEPSRSPIEIDWSELHRLIAVLEGLQTTGALDRDVALKAFVSLQVVLDDAVATTRDAERALNAAIKALGKFGAAVSSGRTDDAAKRLATLLTCLEVLAPGDVHDTDSPL